MLATWKDVENADEPTLHVSFTEHRSSCSDFIRYSWEGNIDTADTPYNAKLYDAKKLRLVNEYYVDRGELAPERWEPIVRQGNDVNLRHAQDTLELLNRVHKGLARIDKRDGQSKSFGQFLARCCRVLGVKKMAIESPKYDGSGGVIWGELGEMADMIDSRVSKHRRELHEQTESQAA